MMQTRIGDWIQTYTGLAFWPLDPRPEEVCIHDIAGALSKLCRFGGHCLWFYSVAEHSIYASRLVSEELALTALLHDATEAYVADVPRPLKRNLSEYRAIEEGVWRAIAQRYGLPTELPQEIKDVDNGLLLTEQRFVMSSPPSPWSVEGKPADVRPICLHPGEAERQFLRRFPELYKGN